MSDGDKVKVEGVRDEDGNLKPDRIDNITTGGEVGKYRVPELIKASGGKWILGFFIGSAILAIVLVIIFIVVVHKVQQRYENETAKMDADYQRGVKEAQQKYDNEVNEMETRFEEKQREAGDRATRRQEEFSEKVKEWEENKKKRKEEFERSWKEMERKFRM